MLVTTAALSHVYRLHGRTTSEAMKVVYTELSLPTLSWSLTVSLRRESSTMTSGTGSASGCSDDTIVVYEYVLQTYTVNVYIYIYNYYSKSCR